MLCATKPVWKTNSGTSLHIDNHTNAYHVRCAHLVLLPSVSIAVKVFELERELQRRLERTTRDVVATVSGDREKQELLA